MSFTATTKVLLADGRSKPISQLKPGDKVLATSTKTGKTQPEAVAAVLVSHDTGLYDLKIKAGSKTAVIHTTKDHPFWVPAVGGHGGQWIKAGGLRNGTRLRTPSGGTATVTGGWTPPQATGWMWDISVPGGNDHDFYIDVAATAVLVHNWPCAAGPPGRGLQDILNASTRTFTRYLQSVQGSAAQAGRATITPGEAQQLWDEAMARGFTAPRGPEQEWVGGSHINIYVPKEVRISIFPLPAGWLPPGY
jgi:hypothetical protein